MSHVLRALALGIVVWDLGNRNEVNSGVVSCGHKTLCSIWFSKHLKELKEQRVEIVSLPSRVLWEDVK